MTCPDRIAEGAEGAGKSVNAETAGAPRYAELPNTRHG